MKKIVWKLLVGMRPKGLAACQLCRLEKLWHKKYENDWYRKLNLDRKKNVWNFIVDILAKRISGFFVDLKGYGKKKFAEYAS